MDENNNQKDIHDSIVRNVEEAFRQVGSADVGDELRQEIEKEVLEQLEPELKTRVKQVVGERLREIRRKKILREQDKEEWFQRFSLTFRIQHIVLFVSVILLILTGLPLKFPESWWAKFLFSSLGAFAPAKIVHRVSAGGLITVAVFHIFYLLFLKEGRRMFLDVLPRPKDLLDVIANLKYFLGFSGAPAQFGRFSYIEKFDYWAVYWGIVIMVGTGLALWFQDAFMSIMPKFVIDIMKEAHSDEALLATLAIVIWHFYNVHLNPDRFPGTLLWWHGRISREEMLKDHPLEYERMMTERLKNSDEDGENAQE
ncbi:MAG: cytochrome b/b6 domain-containing protein [bacterium]